MRNLQKLYFSSLSHYGKETLQLEGWLRTLAALPENPDSVPTWQLISNSSRGKLAPSPGLLRHCMYIMHRRTFRQNIHIEYKLKNLLRKENYLGTIYIIDYSYHLTFELVNYKIRNSKSTCSFLSYSIYHVSMLHFKLY